MSLQNFFRGLVTFDVPRVLRSGGVAIGFQDRGGVTIGGAPPIYTFGSQPAANSVAFGTVIGLNPSFLIGTGATTLPIFVVSDTVKWMPFGKQDLFQGIGSSAAPIATMGAQNPAVETVFNIGTNPGIPTGLLYAGCGIEIEAVFTKTGADTASSIFSAKFGKNNSSSDDIWYLGTSAGAASANQDCLLTARIITMGAAGVAVSTMNSIPRNAGATNTIRDRQNVGLDTTLTNYLSFRCTPPNITATHALLNYTVRWVK